MRRVLTSERITQLALELTMLSTPPAIGLAAGRLQELEGALRWHRDSCRPFRLAGRVVQALISRRLPALLSLVSQQGTMLRMAADDGSDDAAVLESLMALSDAWVQFELGPHATPKARLALATCRTEAERTRFAQLVRQRDITVDHKKIALQRLGRRRAGAYASVAVLAGWPGLIFCCMAAQGALDLWQLACYLIGDVAITVWLTRGMFVEIRSDTRTVQEVNSMLSPRELMTVKTAN